MAPAGLRRRGGNQNARQLHDHRLPQPRCPRRPLLPETRIVSERGHSRTFAALTWFSRAMSHSIFDSKADVGLRVVRSGFPVSASVKCVNSPHARSAEAISAELSRESATITEARRGRIIAGPRGVASPDGFAGFRDREGFFEAPVAGVLGQPAD